MSSPLPDIDERIYPPLDIYTPIVDQRGLPTRQFAERSKQVEKLLLVEHNESRAMLRDEIILRAEGDAALASQITEMKVELEDDIAAAITEEREAWVAADSANALVVDAAVAQALGIEAAVLVRMEASSTPQGVTARYRIVVKATVDSTAYLAGIYFDIIEVGGSYQGRVHIDADHFSIGNASTGVFPFYIQGGVVYMDTAHIRNLTLGTDKLANNAVSNGTAAFSSGSASVGGSYATRQNLSLVCDGGRVMLRASFDIVSVSAQASVQYRLLRNGVVQLTKTSPVRGTAFVSGGSGGAHSHLYSYIDNNGVFRTASTAAAGGYSPPSVQQLYGTQFGIDFLDTNPGEGLIEYLLQVRYTSGSGSINNRFLSAINLKK